MRSCKQHLKRKSPIETHLWLGEHRCVFSLEHPSRCEKHSRCFPCAGGDGVVQVISAGNTTPANGARGGLGNHILTHGGRKMRGEGWERSQEGCGLRSCSHQPCAITSWPHPGLSRGFPLGLKTHWSTAVPIALLWAAARWTQALCIPKVVPPRVSPGQWLQSHSAWHPFPPQKLL